MDEINAWIGHAECLRGLPSNLEHGSRVCGRFITAPNSPTGVQAAVIDGITSVRHLAVPLVAAKHHSAIRLLKGNKRAKLGRLDSLCISLADPNASTHGVKKIDFHIRFISFSLLFFSPSVHTES